MRKMRVGTGAPVSVTAGADRYPEHNQETAMSQQAQPHEASEPETPHLDFAGTTPYEDYVKADVLTHLQHTLSDDPGEMVFLVTTQSWSCGSPSSCTSGRPRPVPCARTTCPSRSTR